MRIGLLSDTHGFFDDILLEHFKDVDEIWHAGDIGPITTLEKLEAFKTTRAVFGNIDDTVTRVATSEHLKFTCEGMKVWITHIAGYPGRYYKNIREEMKKFPPDLFICGHSHILKVMYDKKYKHLHMNPGAAGNHGIHNVKTALIFTISDGKVSDLSVIEIKR